MCLTVLFLYKNRGKGNAMEVQYETLPEAMAILSPKNEGKCDG